MTRLTRIIMDVDIASNAPVRSQSLRFVTSLILVIISHQITLTYILHLVQICLITLSYKDIDVPAHQATL